MGKIDVDKMNAERAKRNSGGESFDAPEGESRIYVCAFPRPEDDMPFAEFRMHYSIGLKGQDSHMCLEPSLNKILLLDSFQEQLAVFKKEIGPCETCERRDRGEIVSGKEGEDGKSQSRWLWLIVPMGHRTDARQKWNPPKEMTVKSLSASYRVWDGLMDQFGQCGDLTDMDAAIFPRLIREGTKMNTKWEVQSDVESIRKPVKLDKDLRAHIAEVTQPGANLDPMRILAHMLKTPADISKFYIETNKASDEYEQPEGGGDAESKPAGGYKPPVKGKSQAQVPAGKAPAPNKPAATTKAPAAAGGTKAPAPKAESKPATKPSSASPASKANAQLKALVQHHGQPPGCYQVDPDAEAEICIKCPFQELCFNHCGVPLPEAADEQVVEEKPADDEVVADEEPAGMTVEQCVAGETYVVNGQTGTFKGPAKGKFYFAGEDGKAFAVEAGTAVDAPADEEAPAEEESESAEDVPAEDEDAKLKEMEAALAARKAKKPAPTKK